MRPVRWWIIEVIGFYGRTVYAIGHAINRLGYAVMCAGSRALQQAVHRAKEHNARIGASSGR